MDELVFQVLAYGYTDRQAAIQFARKWFPEPREIESFTKAETFKPATFKLANGVATYKVVFVPEVPLVSAPIWKVYRTQKG